MKRRDVLAGGLGAAAAMVTFPATAGETVNVKRADAGLPPLNQETGAMRGPAYEKDIFVIRAPGTISTEGAAALLKTTQDKLGDDVIVMVLGDGMTLERIPANPRRTGRFTY